MSNFIKNQQEENMYLSETLKAIEKELIKETENLQHKNKSLISSRKEMWEAGVHFSDDVDRIPELLNYLSEVSRESRTYDSVVKNVEKYTRMINTPYFARIDFKEENYDSEKIYIGMHSLIDSDTKDIYIYDWRAPISSMFYRCELGNGSYISPQGIIEGNITLKRQYKIEKSVLKFFFDSSVKIDDEILQQVLSRNASPKMRNIVETIQKEQDMIIRDTDNELLIVQGVAGSGKTSIALHRIAFLLYEGLSSRLQANNVIIISPNDTFSRYIEGVLPELGEDNVENLTFDKIIRKHICCGYLTESRSEQLERLVTAQEKDDFAVLDSSIKFKGSVEFVNILNRLVRYCEKHLIDFQDIYYDKKIIYTRQELRNFFLDNKINLPIAKRLNRIENMILNKIHALRKERLQKIEEVVEKCDNHRLEIKAFARLMAIKESDNFINYLKKFTVVNYVKLYYKMFSNKKLFLMLARGLQLPRNIEDILEATEINFLKNKINYEDCAALLYIKFKLEGSDNFSQIKQVVIDEAQDYYPLQYEVFKLLFKEARYTVLGDYNQSLERQGNANLYNDIERIFGKKKSIKLFMKKSFRSSYEINRFSKKLLDGKEEIISFDRHEEEPKIISAKDIYNMDRLISEDIDELYKKGYETIGVICKTRSAALEAEHRLKELVSVKILDKSEDEIKKGVLVVPSYLAKGLEFDAVIVYNASNRKYKSEIDRRLFYVACTRALHQLHVYYVGEKNKFLSI
ncbi:HelD family protein [Clostridium oryzae]|uniref:Helicase IV n=1 Tax=Clostridium oryzae TaxID=1450648 RepID=A0A1V4ICC8_9CLOT|nr:UvrD-helicase domain-containing protein [Clostridium oryzae]OPJ57606.1 helicase IV [Clostridium oryzae]